MSEKNPIEEKLTSQKERINHNSELKPKKKPKNYLVIITSVLLLSGVVIGIIRVLMKVLG